jgi:hypothetical protein
LENSKSLREKGCIKNKNSLTFIYSEIWLNLPTDENLHNFGYFTKLKEKKKKTKTPMDE